MLKSWFDLFLIEPALAMSDGLLINLTKKELKIAYQIIQCDVYGDGDGYVYRNGDGYGYGDGDGYGNGYRYGDGNGDGDGDGYGNGYGYGYD